MDLCTVMSQRGGIGAGRRPPGVVGRRELLTLTLALAGAARFNLAAAATADLSAAASRPVAALNDGLLAVMRAGRAVPFATRYAQLAPLVEGAFDFPAILKGAVGLRWSLLADEDRTALLDAFRRYTVSSYVANFNNFGGERFIILPEQRSVGDATVVATEIAPPSGKPARIDYVLHAAPDESGGAAWKIFDILLDGSISQVAAQRSEFHGLLGDGGASRLIDALDKKATILSDNP
jgi:phospholipid transport system substrate-binding protein